MNYRSIGMLAGLALVALPPESNAAGGLDSAAVTRVFNQVELLDPARPAQAAKVGDNVSGQTAVQTGNQSRAELRFNDQTLTRLGANSVFSFQRGTRDLNLEEGVILLEVPKDAGGATINTAAVTAAVTGTTVMVESRKGKKDGAGIVKFIVLEGTMRLTLNGRTGESVLLSAGQMISFGGKINRLPEPVTIDVGRLQKPPGLMSRQFGPLRNEPFIRETIGQQTTLKSQGKLITVNYGLAGKRKNPALQAINFNNQASLRTDAEVTRPVVRRNNPSVARPRPAVGVNNPPKPKPPKPPVVRPPKPPAQPPGPKPPRPPAPPNVPPPPPNYS